MKLIRFGELSNEKPGILAQDGSRRDCSADFHDWNGNFLASGGLEKLSELEIENLPTVPEDSRWGSPIARPGKIICIGANYSDHAKETGKPVPEEPILFQKGTNTIVGPNDTILIPRNSQKTDYEIELAVIIGKEARYLESIEDAENHIAGYAMANDVSEREFQKVKSGGQWTKGKSCDTFFPFGPIFATRDEIPEPMNLEMKLTVNGEVRQESNSNLMVFNIFFLIHYISQFMTLEPGDVISTGTPAGVGLGMDPPGYLKDGDIVEATIKDLGNQKLVFNNA